MSDIWTATITGRRVDLLDTDPDTICLEDIVYHHARCVRFNGHTKAPYYLAQHCIDGADRIHGNHRAAFLLHDAHETYIGDISRPVANALIVLGGADVLGNIKRRIQCVINKKYGVDTYVYEVLEADARMLATERRDLMSHSTQNWGCMAEPYKDTIYPWWDCVYGASRFRDALTESGVHESE